MVISARQKFAHRRPETKQAIRQPFLRQAVQRGRLPPAPKGRCGHFAEPVAMWQKNAEIPALPQAFAAEAVSLTPGSHAEQAVVADFTPPAKVDKLSFDVAAERQCHAPGIDVLTAIPLYADVCLARHR
jgi:hypothetical protein